VSRKLAEKQDRNACVNEAPAAVGEPAGAGHNRVVRRWVYRGLALASAWLALGCSSHTIPPPVAYASAKVDAYTAKPNLANKDPNLKPPFGPFDVQTVFYIAKSNDKDRVDYGMRLDQYCAPVSDDAVFPYWRELQHAPPVRSHKISFFQYMAYGFSSQRMLERSKMGGQYLIELKQVHRPILIVTKQDKDGRCQATAYAQIHGVKSARLDYIFAKVAGTMSVDYVDVHGTDPETGQALVERMTP
jgi:Domain of unknown function (DUF4833)